MTEVETKIAFGAFVEDDKCFGARSGGEKASGRPFAESAT